MSGFFHSAYRLYGSSTLHILPVFHSLYGWVTSPCRAYCIVFGHSSADGHPGRVCSSPVMNSPTENTWDDPSCGHGFCSLGHTPRSRIVRLCEKLMIHFLRNCQNCFPKRPHHLHPIREIRGFPVGAPLFREGSSLNWHARGLLAGKEQIWVHLQALQWQSLCS